MASKRGATSELNHDNWNCEDEPEEAGTFSTASEEVLKTRVVRTAKRRLGAGDGADRAKNAFSIFSGFKTDSSAKTSSSSPFSFLAKTNTSETTSSTQASSVFSKLPPISNGSVPKSENGLLMSSSSSSNSTESKKSEDSDKTKEGEKKKLENESMFKTSSDYYAKLKGLNESVASWIKSHVDTNPFCILTPIFKDYEKHLNSIESKHGKNGLGPSNNEKTGNSADKTLNSNTDNEKTNKTDAAERKAELAFQSSSSSSTWGPTKSIFTQSNTTGTGSIFNKSEKTNIFASDNKDSEKISLSSKSAEDSTTSKDKETCPKLETKTLSFPTTAGFSFSSKPAGETSTGFSFGGGKPFSFASSAVVPQSSENKESEEQEDDDEPPKPDFKPIAEDGAIYEKRCKLFVKKDGVFGDRGVGALFLKPTSSEKVQLILRAENSLGNILLNILLTDSIPIKRMNKNTVMLMCLPLPDSTPPPVPILLRVKTSQDADSLYDALISHKK